MASPPKLPESSGRRFSGPSAGELKASGPQPTSPKASGLTFSSGKTGNGKPTAAKPLAGKPSGSGPSGSGNGTTDTKGAGTNGPGPQAKDKDAAKAPGGKPGEAKALDSKKADSKKADSQNADAKVGAAGKPGVTKPAIAPQATGRHFDKERSTGGFLAMGVVLTVVVCGLAFWIKLGSETPPTEELAAVQTAPQAETTLQTIPDTPVADTPAPAATGRSSRMPGGQAAGEAQAPARTPAQEMALSTAEIAEVQNLLSRLDFDPGCESGGRSAATTAASRSYQEMAGLPADGSANQALLEELRSVVALYGS
ncbi:MAG: peptidoglycan-binding protein [Kiloniellaceae bacterium]